LLFIVAPSSGAAAPLEPRPALVEDNPGRDAATDVKFVPPAILTYGKPCPNEVRWRSSLPNDCRAL